MRNGDLPRVEEDRLPWTAYYEPERLTLNLSEQDLGHPLHPGLWDQLHTATLPRGTIRCMGALTPDGCTKNPDGAMFLRWRAGRRQAIHYPAVINRNEHTSEESDTHKALKDYIAQSAQRHGFRAVTEATTSQRRRRADVTISGAHGRELRVEAQVSAIHPGTVAKRDRLDRQDGATPLWVTREVRTASGQATAPEWVDRSPWALIRPAPWQDIAAGVDLDVRGGVKRLVFERCGRRQALCPDRARVPGRTGDPCGQEHAYFDPMHAVVLADLVGQVAAGHMVDIRVPRGKARVNYHLVTAQDAAEWNAYGTAAEPIDDEQADEFNHLSPQYRCATRTWDRIDGAGGRRLDPSAAVYSGITRTVKALPSKCAASACDGTGNLLRCQLCPHSPTYWRNTTPS